MGRAWKLGVSGGLGRKRGWCSKRKESTLWDSEAQIIHRRSSCIAEKRRGKLHLCPHPPSMWLVTHRRDTCPLGQGWAGAAQRSATSHPLSISPFLLHRLVCAGCRGGEVWEGVSRDSGQWGQGLREAQKQSLSLHPFTRGAHCRAQSPGPFCRASLPQPRT